MLYRFRKTILISKFGLNKTKLALVFNNILINTKLKYLNLKKKHLNLLNIIINQKLYLDLNKKVKKHSKKYVFKNIKFLINTNTYTGKRHYYKYPVRGQRTHTNAKTARKALLKIYANKKKN
jgi:ribosomal protein S13